MRSLILLLTRLLRDRSLNSIAKGMAGSRP
jgi:hypothetical protein